MRFPRTLRTLFALLALSLLAALALPLTALAGGWAVVSLDSLPAEPRAGQTLSLGLMVRQHGQTPVDSFYGMGEPIKPYLTARNRDTGESIRAEARKEGPVGHFVVEVTFPSAGTWEWAITPPPFEGTKFEPLTVWPALAAAAEPSTADVATSSAPGTDPAPQPALATAPDRAPVNTRGFEPAVLRWAAMLLLIAAAGTALIALARPHQRGTFGRWLAPRSR